MALTCKAGLRFYSFRIIVESFHINVDGEVVEIPEFGREVRYK